MAGAPGETGEASYTVLSNAQFISPSGDPRSRHSSAGSDHAPRSAPLSPMVGGGGGGGVLPLPGPVRTRHQSAGNIPSTATIHYRPAWQHQQIQQVQQ